MTAARSLTGSLVIHSARLVDGGSVQDDAWVRFDDGKVSGRGVGDSWTAADEVVDAAASAGQGALLTP